jgi:hypothetical protein
MKVQVWAMRTFRALLATSGVVAAGTTGCAQPGIVEVNEMNPPITAQDSSIVSNDSGVGPVPVLDTGVAPVLDTGVAPVLDTGVAPVLDTGIAPVLDSGVAQDTGVVETGPAPLPPCPTGYTCQDPHAMINALGAEGMVTDATGKRVTLACGKTGIINCDPKNPKTSCKDFTNPYCAHLVIVFPPLDTYSCAQECSK